MDINKLFYRGIIYFFLVLILILYCYLGIQSSYRSYAMLGYGTDMTTRWVGTRNLIKAGINPYSEEGQRLIEEAYFGHRLSPTERFTRDNQHFVYPLYVIFIYLPLVYMDISNAYLLFWIINLTIIILTCFFLIKLIKITNHNTTFISLIGLLIASPVVFYSLQSRQLIVLVFGLLIISLYILLNTNTVGYLFLAGIMLFMTTIKPQSSLLALAYFFVILLPSWADKKRIISLWIGFLTMAIFSLVITNQLVPGWIFDFINELKQYRIYAGSTGAESLLGRNYLSYFCLSFFCIVALIMTIIAYKINNILLKILTYFYIFVLQGFIFPAHLYIIIMGIPLILVSIKLNMSLIKYNTFIYSLNTFLLLLTIYTIYRFWLNLVLESSINNKLINIATLLGSYCPFIRIYAVIPIMMILGIVCFIGVYKYNIELT
jgi:hypothetical protein